MTVFLGIDIGTSSVKSVLVDGRQRIRAEASFPLAISRPRPGWTEQGPDLWWRGVQSTLGELKRKAARDYEGIGSIGLSGQMHGAVLIDAALRPLRPSILWDDGRAAAEAAEINETFPDVAAVAGILAMPGFTAPKILWLARHEAERMKRVACVLQAKDFIRMKLTGERATDMSDASGTLFLDVGRRRWSERMVEHCGLTVDQLPTLHEGTAATGTLRPAVARSLGLSPSVVVAAGGGDVAAGAVGLGAIAEGRSFISIGTSGQYFVARERFAPRPGRHVHSFGHCVPGLWFDMAALLNGASPFAWLARLLGMDVGSMLGLARHRREGPAPLFMPYLSGERTPHNDPEIRGSLIGLGHETDAAALVRAAIEGVALSFADVAGDLGHAEIPGVVGGAARSALVMQALANALGRTVLRYKGAEFAAAFGAARLARMAFTGEPAESVALPPAVDARFHPQQNAGGDVTGRLDAFRRAHAAFGDIRSRR